MASRRSHSESSASRSSGEAEDVLRAPVESCGELLANLRSRGELLASRSSGEAEVLRSREEGISRLGISRDSSLRQETGGESTAEEEVTGAENGAGDGVEMGVEIGVGIGALIVDAKKSGFNKSE